MGRGDIGEIEGRILPQQDDVKLGELNIGLAEGEMIAFAVAYRQQRPHRREHPSLTQRQLVRRVIGDGVPALLRFQ